LLVEIGKLTQKEFGERVRMFGSRNKEHSKKGVEIANTHGFGGTN